MLLAFWLRQETGRWKLQDREKVLEERQAERERIRPQTQRKMVGRM